MASPRPVRLFLLGMLTLFLELVLIRYLAGNVWNLGYFPNLVLIAAFVGMGLGFVGHPWIHDEKSPRYLLAAAFALAILSAFVGAVRPSMPRFGGWEGSVGGELYFSLAPSGASTHLLFFLVWFTLTIAVFALISQQTAKVFRAFPPLRAYTLDILGSCSGVLTFMALSWLRLPAWSWFLLVAALFVAVADDRSLRWRSLAPLLIVALLAFLQDSSPLSSTTFIAHEARWSPYQRLDYVEDRQERAILSNGLLHQNLYSSTELAGSFYSVPHRRRAARQPGSPYRRVLIIGAGSGNDAAEALAAGAEHVDAVEIDPVIADLGRRRHPARPYADPRVRVTVDDGRAFIARSQPGQYDLIIFALTDSLVRVSSVSQLRLENFLFTLESVRKAYQLLSPDGDLLLYNYYRQPWLVEKFQRMMHQATGRNPEVIFRDQDFVMLLVGRGWPPAPAAAGSGARIDIPTDDWPFPYLQRHAIPRVYSLALVAVSVPILLLMLLRLTGRGRRAEEGPGSALVNAAFFFMGTAFLLLETKSVVQFSLLFGTTWVNTSLVFLGILTLVLAANWLAARLPGTANGTLWAIYVLLVAACLVPFFIPLARLLNIESGLLRFLVAALMTFAPIFFANLLFSVAFRDRAAPEHTFGWNLLGATLGGVIEYTSTALGYNALAVIVAGCYSLVFILLLAGLRRAAPPKGAAADSR